MTARLSHTCQKVWTIVTDRSSSLGPPGTLQDTMLVLGVNIGLKSLQCGRVSARTLEANACLICHAKRRQAGCWCS